jgi:hypothetical protein
LFTGTPATATTSVGTHSDGSLFKEDWEYASIVGTVCMMMYLASNTRPGIAYRYCASIS